MPEKLVQVIVIAERLCEYQVHNLLRRPLVTNGKPFPIKWMKMEMGYNVCDDGKKHPIYGWSIVRIPEKDEKIPDGHGEFYFEARLMDNPFQNNLSNLKQI